MIREHEDKIAKELDRTAPDIRLIRKWEKDINKSQRLMRDLEEKLAR